MVEMREGRNGGKLKSGNIKNVGRKKLPNLKEALANVLGDDKDGISAAEAILMALRAKATKGDVRAAELLLDRAYGKSSLNIDLDASINTVIMPKSIKQEEEPEDGND